MRGALVWILLLAGLPLCAQTSVEHRGDLVNLVGDWSFFPGDAREYALPSFDDASWKKMRLPQNWHRAGYNYDGIAWFRKKVFIGEELRGHAIGLVLPLREGWHEVYLNGHRIDDGAALESSPRAAHATRALPLVIPESAVQFGGENTISIRARSYGGVGGFITRSMYIGTMGAVERRYSLSSMWNTVLVTLFILTGFTHLVTFLSRRKEYHYLHFAVFSTAIGFIVASIDNLTHFAADSFVLQHTAAHLPMIAAPVALIGFAHSLFGRGSRIAVWLGRTCAAVLGAVFLYSLTGPVGYGIYLRFFFPWVLFTCAVVIVYCGVIAAMSMQEGVFTGRIIVPGFALFALAVINDILSYLTIIDTPNVVEEGFFCFVVSMSASLSLKYARLQDSLHNLNRRLHDNIRALQSARTSIEESEKKYRELVESTHEIIFTLDSTGIITMINQAVGHQLGIPAQELIGQDFLALIYYPGTDSKNSLARHTVRQKLRELLETRKDVTFRTDFFTRTREPRELIVKLQYIPQGSSYTISGNASVEAEDELRSISISERQVYVFGNYVYISDAISQRIFLGMLKYTDHDSAYAVKICLREIIINAIEHGNLGITFEEKTEAQNEGTYFSLLLSRQTDPVYGARTVRLVYSLNRKRALFRITDQGEGFDHASVMNRDIKQPEYFHLMHGRGIAMARIEFDRIRYNERGNSVLLMRSFENHEKKN